MSSVSKISGLVFVRGVAAMMIGGEESMQKQVEQAALEGLRSTTDEFLMVKICTLTALVGFFLMFVVHNLVNFFETPFRGRETFFPELKLERRSLVV